MNFLVLIANHVDVITEEDKAIIVTKQQASVFVKENSKVAIAVLAKMNFMVLIANPVDAIKEEVKTINVTK